MAEFKKGDRVQRVVAKKDKGTVLAVVPKDPTDIFATAPSYVVLWDKSGQEPALTPGQLEPDDSEPASKEAEFGESNSNEEEGIDVEAERLEAELDERGQRIAKLEDQGANWNNEGRFWSLGDKTFDEDGNPM
jgi:hypothetical protein